MRRSAILAVAVGLVASSPAAAVEIDHRIPTITTVKQKQSWSGATMTATNPSNYTDTVPRPELADRCTKEQTTYCEHALVRVVLSDVGGGTLKFRLEGFMPTSDFDLRVYDADETGEPVGGYRTPKGDSTDGPLGDDDPRNTWSGDYETTLVDLSNLVDPETGALDAYFLVQVPYWLVANDSYDASVELVDVTPFEPFEDFGF